MLGAVEALLVYMYDYYSQIAGETPPAGKGIPDHLLDGGAEIIPIREDVEGRVRESIKDLMHAAEAVRAATEPGTYEGAYARLLSAIRRAVRCVPVIVHVAADSQMEVDAASGRARVLGQFDWAHREDPEERNGIWIAAEAGRTTPPGTYYLPPAWRKGNRTYYPVSERTPLLLAVREPDWRKWDAEAANASWLRLEGVPWELLERAIALADLSKPELGGPAKPRPKVGALIYGGGRILGEASRDQDGAGGHAEELALSRVKREDRADVAGAIAITTLEPCITGRSPGKAECTLLLLKNGVKKVIIGMLDPNRQILGIGYRTLVDNGVEVAFFPSALHTKIWNMNREFVAAHIEQDVRPFRLPRIVTVGPRREGTEASASTSQT